MKRKTAFLLGGFLLLTTAIAQAAVGDLSWTGKTSWTYNKEIAGDKPGDQWDTQKTDQEANPVKWVLHKMGGNPVIWLRIDDTVSIPDTVDLSADIRTRYEARGIAVDTIQKKSIGGQDVFLVSGFDKSKDTRYSSAFFRRYGTKRAYEIELTAPSNEFASYEPAYMGMVQTVRVLSNTAAQPSFRREAKTRE